LARRDVPQVLFANVGGSGSWAYRFPEGVFAPDDPLAVRRLEGPLVFETPYGESPPFGLYELLDRRRGRRREFLRVWMHGLQPEAVGNTPEDPLAATPLRAAEKVFAVLRRAGTRWVLVDASVGGLNKLLDPWDLVIPHDYFDDMKRLARLEVGFDLSIRHPYCRHLRRVLCEAAGARLGPYAALAARVEGRPVHPKVVRRGVYVCPDGPWFETYAQVADYQHRGFDVVGKTVVPEVQLARAIGAHFGSLNPVVNPAEGLVDPDSGAVFPWTTADLQRIYDHYGPAVSAIVLEAMARIDPAAPDCPCAAEFREGPVLDYGRFLEA
jgi:5'-methylthioadenosine phosphorylase